MARFHGRVGYGETVDTGAGVYEDVITEYTYSGDVIRDTRQLVEADKVNKDLSVSNQISIVADEYANDHFFAIRYVEWAGLLWTVTDVEVQAPRLLLRLGEVYNGPTPAAP
jgi:hypothetical protein